MRRFVTYQQIIETQNHKGKRKSSEKTRKRKFSLNEATISLLDEELRQWVKVIRPSRASITYERYE